ncbi:MULTISPECIES: hypothetical protein [unclassified Shinella]|jgi:hypothetical protein|uniref:hypothetical protein n=1 Tax=unclassified Shinella TaxID=2643062 RepID=UPI00102D4F57|nr:hypothetical protein [Shinella sp. JR1-6]TAA56381.1 hypothetical protein EXZ48_22625 [Shinella sp. JR1-6]
MIATPHFSRWKRRPSDQTCHGLTCRSIYVDININDNGIDTIVPGTTQGERASRFSPCLSYRFQHLRPPLRREDPNNEEE